jgi:ABC-type lipoprotein release transport system permease subunit
MHLDAKGRRLGATNNELKVYRSQQERWVHMTRLLYQVSASNPFVFGGPAAALFVFALLACYVPAWGASRVDPLVALWDE